MLIRLASLIVAFAGLLLSPVSVCAQFIDFNRDVRPILADRCFQCHGPDAGQRQAELRLDVTSGGERESGPVIVAGEPEKSSLWKRVISDDGDERMPPPEKGPKLTAKELATLRQWIVEGGKFEKHWSLLSVRRPSVPVQPWAANNAIDSFVRARLEQEGLKPAEEADRWTLLRRATLALTGLPPAPDEIGAFTRDGSPDAYEREVDRLLASPRYGEQMARPWLDAARYADTSGYQSDGERHMWRWRDWVIDALNSNMPFDQFTIEQLGGDLLPNATLEQRIATGFNRNHRGNAEGGIIPEEYAVEYVADRVETTATVWLGLTLGCSRCHDHKYDPLTQRDFYSLYAFFNSVPEKGRAIKIGNSPPFVLAPTRLQRERLLQLEQMPALQPQISSSSFLAMVQWEASQKGKAADWYPTDGLVAHLPLDGDLKNRSKEAAAELPAGSSEFTAGRLGKAGRFRGDHWLELPKAGEFGFFDKFTLAAWVYFEPGAGGTILSRMVDDARGEGYQLTIVNGKLQFNLSNRWLDDALRVETADTVVGGTWRHVLATYDGTRVADGVKLYVDGQEQKLTVLLDELNQTFSTKQPLRIGGGGGTEGRFRGAIDEVRIYRRCLSADEAKALATAQTLDEIFAIDVRERTAGQMAKYQFAFLEEYGPKEIRAAYKAYVAGQRQLAEFREKLPTVMVMQEMPTPRAAHVLLRGQYDKPGERVEREVPAELPRMASDLPRDRLGLAQWLVDRENPLTSRVTVNRFWQQYFGTGLVKTSEDFGRQGEWPSHPELLDWLAAEFMGTSWDVKRLQRMLVSSATFRQRSGISNFKFQISNLDSENRLLSRGPRLRLAAETVRDQALFAGGLLVEQVGGPSVKPLQPAGLWSELTGGSDYKAGEGAELVRRSLYTFWKRTIPPPLLSTFDASSRETCIVRQSRTNTPLQALALMNEPTLVMAAEGLARRVMSEATSPEERIERAMLYVVGRRPSEEEQRILGAALARYLAVDSARGASGPRAGEPDELSAYSLVCSTILNLDEAVTSQ